MHWVFFILVGLLAGFLAGQVMRGRSFGVLGNLIVGVVGSVFGGWIFGVLGISFGGLIGSLLCAFLGACLLLYLLRLVVK
ncbi:MAG: GlsB/YeaQ/YmgE family stress response membrane protein [Verrucomicrobia bacterium]|nr:GlsB/YeaQ/YmgE family stress response membrane protein [Verrucomicrobiota bacterium]